MNVVLIGANGQLGTDLQIVLMSKGIAVRPVVEPELDVRDAEAVAALIASASPQVVINTAAFHQVEQCEKQPGTAFEVNALGARNVAVACEQHGAVLVHFSTDYVFGGVNRQQPYVETDLPAPSNSYGVSKVAGEHMVACTTRRHFIIRPCGLFGLAGPYGKGSNFVENMLKKAREGAAIRVVDDQVLTPTYTLPLAEKLTQLILTEAYGLYHLSCEGQCSWHEFAHKIFELSGINVNLSPCKTSDFPSPVKRPSYSVMSKAKFNALGLGEMPHWSVALERYLEARKRKSTAMVC
jgi:dTDP-4-dehydrorhamnose reductase